MAMLEIMVDSVGVENALHVLSLLVTVEQEVAIHGLFQLNKWKIIKEGIPDKCDVCHSSIKRNVVVEKNKFRNLVSSAESKGEFNLAYLTDSTHNSTQEQQFKDMDQLAAGLNGGQNELSAMLNLLPGSNQVSSGQQQSSEDETFNELLMNDQDIENFENIEDNFIYKNRMSGKCVEDGLEKNHITTENRKIKLVVSGTDSVLDLKNKDDIKNTTAISLNVDNDENNVEVCENSVNYQSTNEISLESIQNNNNNFNMFTEHLQEKNSNSGVETELAEDKFVGTVLSIKNAAGISELNENILDSENLTEKVNLDKFQSDTEYNENDEVLDKNNCVKVKDDGNKKVLTFKQGKVSIHKNSVRNAKQAVKEKIEVKVNKNELRDFTKSESNSGCVDESSILGGTNSELNKTEGKIKGNYLPYKCDKCKEGFINKDQLQRHEKVHSINSPFICHLCGKLFMRRDSLRIHEKTHQANMERRFKCNICDKKYIYACSLKKHLLVHSGIKPYICDVCGKRFRQSSHLKDHLKTHDTDKRKTKQYKCEYCDKYFTHASTRARHRLLHTGAKPYRCKVCGRQFTQSFHMKSHEKLHNSERPHVCSVCNKGFATLQSLNVHFKNIHVQKREEDLHHCTVCNKSFQLKGTLKKHMNIHTHEKLHKCDICNRTFTQSVSLKRHQKVHERPKVYKCYICGATFTDKVERKKHSRWHDKERDKLKEHRCEICHRVYSTRASCLKHVKQEHGISVGNNTAATKEEKIFIELPKVIVTGMGPETVFAFENP